MATRARPLTGHSRAAAIAVTLVLTVVACGASESGSVITLSSESPAATGSPSSEPSAIPPVVPVVADPPENVSCPEDWLYFDNPVMHYGLCYPPDWGFTDHEHPSRLEAISSFELHYLRLGSPDTFPWTPGTAKIDTDTIEIQLTLLDRDASLVGNACMPSSAVTVGNGSDATWCDATYDMPFPPKTTANPSGAFYSLIAVIQLRQTPEGTRIPRDLTGARLGFFADTSGSRYRSDQSLRHTLTQILDLVTPY